VSAQRVRIASRDNALLMRVRRLHATPDAYRRLGSVWLEGDHLVRAALARGWPLQELLVAAFQQAGDDLATAVLKQGLLSDPIDKTLTFFIVFALLAALSRRFVARFPQGRLLVVPGIGHSTTTADPSSDQLALMPPWFLFWN